MSGFRIGNGNLLFGLNRKRPLLQNNGMCVHRELAPTLYQAMEAAILIHKEQLNKVVAV